MMPGPAVAEYETAAGKTRTIGCTQTAPLPSTTTERPVPPRIHAIRHKLPLARLITAYTRILELLTTPKIQI